MKRVKELSERDVLYNAVLETVKKHGAGMEIGLVRAVLGEVDGAIGMMVNRNSFESVCEKMKERKPREHK